MRAFAYSPARSRFAEPIPCGQDPPSRDPEVPRKLSRGFVKCPTREDAARELAKSVASAVRMLDNVIGELARARQAACGGKPLGWPNLSDLTACWLKYRLGVCIDNLAAWTAGTIRKSTNEPVPVAEVIRRLVRPRNLLASNAITYVCESSCDEMELAWVRVRNAADECLPGTPERIIHLCPLFWRTELTPYREQTLIHEASHLTHCNPHNKKTAVGIGWPECLSQFVVACNGRKLDPTKRTACGFTKKCGGSVPALCRKPEYGKPPPDWQP